MSFNEQTDKMKAISTASEYLALREFSSPDRTKGSNIISSVIWEKREGSSRWLVRVAYYPGIKTLTVFLWNPNESNPYPVLITREGRTIVFRPGFWIVLLDRKLKEMIEHLSQYPEDGSDEWLFDEDQEYSL